MEKDEVLFLVSCCGQHVGVPGTKDVVLSEARTLAVERFWDLWKHQTPDKLSEDNIAELDLKLYALLEEPLPLQSWLDNFKRVRITEDAIIQLQHELRVDRDLLVEIAILYAKDLTDASKLKAAALKVERAEERLLSAKEAEAPKRKK